MKNAPRLVLAVVFAAFTLIQIQTCIEKGGQPLRRLDAQSEKNSSYGAERFVADGFATTSFLPRYDAPLNLDSGSPMIRESDIYTHYFPGPDFVLALSYAVFGSGETVLRWTRLVPLLHVLVAALLLLALAERRLWPARPWITTAMACLLFLPPAMRDWSLSLHGHSYTSAYVMAALALGLCGDEGGHRMAKIAAAFALGFLSNYMLLTAAFVVCAAPLSASLLVPERRAQRFAVALSIAVGLGLVFAFGVHYLQIVHQFGWQETRLDLFGVLGVRAGEGGAGTTFGQLFAQYQEEVARFFGLSSLIMLLVGLWGAAGRSDSTRNRLAAAVGMLLAFAGSWAWIFLMRQHSAQHGHVNPRIFLLVYACSLLSAGTLAASPETAGAVTSPADGETILPQV